MIVVFLRKLIMLWWALTLYFPNQRKALQSQRTTLQLRTMGVTASQITNNPTACSTVPHYWIKSDPKFRQNSTPPHTRESGRSNFASYHQKDVVSQTDPNLMTSTPCAGAPGRHTPMQLAVSHCNCSPPMASHAEAIAILSVVPGDRKWPWNRLQPTSQGATQN